MEDKPVEVTTEIQEVLAVDSNVKEVDPNGGTIDGVVLPTSIYNDMIAAITTINEMEKDSKNTDDETDDEFDDSEALAVGLVSDGLRVTVKNNSFVKPLRDAKRKWEQEPKYADKALHVRDLPIGGKGGKELKGTAAAAKFYSYLGKGGIIQVPLWHSGFWISLKTIKESDILNLEMQLANNQIKLGRETNTLIFSNYSVVFVRLLSEFIIRHIQSSTLKFDGSINNITKYIKIQDMQALALGLIQSMYLNGFKDVRTCVNSTNVKPDGKPECSYTMESVIDPKKLLWVDRKAISKEHMEVMIKRAPNTVTVNDVLEYQSTLPVNKVKEIVIPTENQMDVILKLKSPDIRTHIENGERWVNNIIKLTEELFTEKLTIDEKNIRINAASKMVLLSMYNHYIESIALPDGTTVTDRKSIDEILEILVSDKVAYNKTLEDVKEYIDDNIISVVAIPNYKCPSCSAIQKEKGEEDKPFNDLIPINIFESFFDLCILKTNKITERGQEDNM